MTDLQQKAREALNNALIIDVVNAFGTPEPSDTILSLTWRDLGVDSDEKVFLIGHPDQERPSPSTFNAPWYDIIRRLMNKGWRRTLEK